MIKLSREIRFSLVPFGEIPPRASANTWAGWPASDLIAPHLVLRCVLIGEPDPVTGYLCNIKVVDQMLSEIAVGEIIPKYGSHPQQIDAASLLREISELGQDKWRAIKGASGEIIQFDLSVSPYTKYSIFSKEPSMIEVTRQFEFSAAHRLHCPQFSDEQNLEIFGKCNNPNGHGHNYLVDVTVGVANGPIDIPRLDEIVKKHVITPLDHKHLNEDIDYFRTINPSVENIAKIIFQWLEPELGPAVLKKIRVYETPKTWAEYDAS